MIGLRLDRLVLPLWNLFVRLQPYDAEVQDGIDGVKRDQSGYLNWSGDRPAAVDVAGVRPGQVSVTLDAPCPGQPEPTEELLLAAANVADEFRRHTHFNHPRHEYLCSLSHQLRDRATLFAQNR